MIIVTGAAGFIGSNLVAGLNRAGYMDLVLADEFDSKDKMRNLRGLKWTLKVDRRDFLFWLRENHMGVQFVIHLGARTDTAEMRKEILESLNTGYSRELWNLCCNYGIPVIYASSAATYGGGEHGFSDDHDLPPLLRPLNPYGESKNEFDKWVLSRQKKPWFWAGLKFFNVYGPNEYHKGRMASVVYHSYRQISETGKIKLFRSHNSHYSDGGQKRDFIYVKDVVDVIMFLMHYRTRSGIFNVGTGNARTFLDLARNTFAAMGVKERIEFTDTPADIRKNYQYYTCATMEKLEAAGYDKPFTPLEQGIEEYVGSYLLEERYAGDA